jgi:hypothetical protein
VYNLRNRSCSNTVVGGEIMDGTGKAVLVATLGSA